jgi:hypothetical protein
MGFPKFFPLMLPLYSHYFKYRHGAVEFPLKPHGGTTDLFNSCFPTVSVCGKNIIQPQRKIMMRSTKRFGWNIMQKRGTLGTFGGVFTPSIPTILGIILFLRLGYVVGSSGQDSASKTKLKGREYG